MALSRNPPLLLSGGGWVRVVTVHLPEVYIEAIDQLVRRRLYPNRAEAIRMAIRDFIMEEAVRGE
jgi:Arc/MetJ-type ribon-helix-helix transcriptional regulator